MFAILYIAVYTITIICYNIYVQAGDNLGGKLVHQKSGISVLLVDDNEYANISRRQKLKAKLGDEISNCFIATTKRDVLRYLKNKPVTLVLSTNTVLDDNGTHPVHIDVARLIEKCRPDSDTSHAYMGSVIMPLYFSIGKNRLKKRLRRLQSKMKQTKAQSVS